MTMDRVLVAAPRWLRKNGTPHEPEQLARHECLIQVTPAGDVVPWRYRRKEEERTFEVRGRLRSNAPAALRELAIEGAGVAQLPGFIAAEDIRRGRLRRVLTDWTSPSLPAWAVYRAELRGATRLRAFLEVFEPVRSKARARP